MSPSLEMASMALFEPVDDMIILMPVYVPWIIAVRFVIMMPFIIVSFVVVIVVLANAMIVVSIVPVDSMMIPA